MIYAVFTDGEAVAGCETEEDAREWASRARHWKGVARVTIEAAERDGSEPWRVIYDSEQEELAA